MGSRYWLGLLGCEPPHWLQFWLRCCRGGTTTFSEPLPYPERVTLAGQCRSEIEEELQGQLLDHVNLSEAVLLTP